MTDPPLAVGSRIAFEARFLGRRLAYTYVVVELVPCERLVMRTVNGPFSGGTRMTLRNTGEPSGFSRIAAPAMQQAMRRANRKDLRRLKRLVESAVAATTE